MKKVLPRALEAVPERSDWRFLTVVSTLTRGGTERVAVNFALGYQQAGYASAVLAYNGGGPRKELLDAAGVPVFLGGDNPADLQRAIELARAWKPDILHIHRAGGADPQSAQLLRELIHPSLRVFETNVFGYVDHSPDRTQIDLHFLITRWCLWKWMRSAGSLSPRSPGIVLVCLSGAGPGRAHGLPQGLRHPG
jgi:hypothetical protein